MAIVLIIITTAAIITHVETMKKVLLLAISSLLLVACQRNVSFTSFQSIPSHSWDMDSVVVFHPIVADSIGDYQMLISIRHTDRYAYQNLWMFVDVKQDSVLLRRDTIEAQMANARGEWYGKGLSEHTLPIIYLENITLPKGEYTVGIQQGMREESLRGVSNVGLKLIKNIP